MVLLFTEWSDCLHISLKYYAFPLRVCFFFLDRVIFKGQSLHRNPYLSFPDYFLWGYLKNILYEDCPRSIAKLKVKTEQAIKNMMV